LRDGKGFGSGLFMSFGLPGLRRRTQQSFDIAALSCVGAKNANPASTMRFPTLLVLRAVSALSNFMLQ
jgi:hypothetical protein